MAFNFFHKTIPMIDIFDYVVSMFDGRMGLHELADLHSEKLDEMILKEEANSKKYVGGSFSITLINEAYMELSYELFFKDESGKYTEKTAKSKPVRTSYLDDDAIKIINEQTDKKITFEIDAPNGKK